MTQLGDQLNVNMPESIASIFQHQSVGIPGTSDTSTGAEGGVPDKPPSPISIPRAQISKGIIINIQQAGYKKQCFLFVYCGWLECIHSILIHALINF